MQLPFLLAAAGIAAVGAFTDARTGRIPNWLTLGALAIAPAAHAVVAIVGHEGVHAALENAGASLAGVLVALVPLVLFWKGALGGGDVKLFAALGALAGFDAGLDIVLHSFVVGAVFALAVVTYRGKLLHLVKNIARLARRKAVDERASSSFRLGPAIFVAATLEVAFRGMNPCT